MNRNTKNSILDTCLTSYAFDVVKNERVKLPCAFQGWMSNDFFIFGSHRSEKEKYLVTPSFEGVAVKGINIKCSMQEWLIFQRNGDIFNSSFAKYIQFNFDKYTWEPFFERSWCEKGRLKYPSYIIEKNGNILTAEKSRGCSFLEFSKYIKDKS